jgi:hypothetical protein
MNGIRSHYDEARSWERACRHIALFLWWAAERGLASAEHDVSAIRANPTKHFIEMCDTKLTHEDLTDAGNAFAASAYEDYLTEVSNYAHAHIVPLYEIPEDAATGKHFFAWLDDERLRFSPRRQ